MGLAYSLGYKTRECPTATVRWVNSIRIIVSVWKSRWPVCCNRRGRTRTPCHSIRQQNGNEGDSLHDQARTEKGNAIIRSNFNFTFHEQGGSQEWGRQFRPRFEHIVRWGQRNIHGSSETHSPRRSLLNPWNSKHPVQVSDRLWLSFEEPNQCYRNPRMYMTPLFSIDWCRAWDSQILCWTQHWTNVRVLLLLRLQ